MVARVSAPRPPTTPRSGAAPYHRPRSSLYIVHTPTLEPMVDEETEDDDDDESPSAPTTPSTGESTAEHERETSSTSILPEDASPSFQTALCSRTGGSGLFATRTINRGTVVLSEPPLFTLPLPPARTNSTVMAALSACTREQQREFFTLWNAFKDNEPGGSKSTTTGRAILPALGIFETNALPCFVGPAAQQQQQQQQHRNATPKEQAKCDGLAADANTNNVNGASNPDPGAREGLFLRAARLNHSCRPNVTRVWDAGAEEMVFRALRDVHAEEELCINYADVDVLGTRVERRAELVDAFGFVCSCEACALEGDEGDESDRRRRAVRRLFEEVGACGKEPTLGMRKIKFALRLLRDEGLVHYEASFCFDAFQFCVLVSDFANAKAWVRKAWESVCSTAGPESAAARMLKMYWANPRAHQLAGLLPQATLSGPD